MTVKKRMMTFELGRMSTWRFPRRSALTMLFRASAVFFNRSAEQWGQNKSARDIAHDNLQYCHTEDRDSNLREKGEMSKEIK
jgi:hypothetical protein